MPIYEYECRGCHRRLSFLVRSAAHASSLRCPRCGSAELSRLMSRFFSPRSEDDRLESLADPGQYGDLDESDPRSMARFMKKMGQEFGDDLGDDFGEAVDEAMSESAADEGTGESSDQSLGSDDDS